jgi:thiol-disulfide isomerase/thioredoxin
MRWLPLLLAFLLFLFGCIGTGNGGSTQIDNASASISCSGINLVFIYSDWCPHCAKMKPWVKELMAEGYNVTWINVEDKNGVRIATECLEGIAQLRYIPEFVCTNKKIDKVGEFASKEDMRIFFDNCLK